MKISREKLSILIIFIFALLLPLLISEYWLYVIAIAYYYGVLASTWNLLAGYAGQFSFGHAAFASIGAYTSALLVLNIGIPIPLAMLSGALMSMILSTLIGVMSLRLRGPYLALSTLAFSEILRIVLVVNYKYTRGDLGLSTPPLLPGVVSVIPYYYVALLILVITLITLRWLINQPLGLFLQAIRENEDAAQALGVNTNKYKIIAFAVSCFFAGLAGGFYAHFIQLVSPHIGALHEMTLIIAMTVLGGMGTLWGPIIGAIILRIASEYLREYGMYHAVIFAALIVVMMRFARRGIYGLIYGKIR